MKYLMICGDALIAKYVCDKGVDIIFVDLEREGKLARQGHGTWISNHDLETVTSVRNTIDKDLLVRIEPFHSKSKAQINEVISRGADSIMLPMIKDLSEVESFLNIIEKKARKILLIETKESLQIIDEIINLKDFDEIYIGLNDLHISLGHKFMFESLINGIMDNLAKKLVANKIPFGFGGIGPIGKGDLKAEIILSEHIRLKSSSVILSRSFHHNLSNIFELEEKLNFEKELFKLKKTELELKKLSDFELKINHEDCRKQINSIIGL